MNKLKTCLIILRMFRVLDLLQSREGSGEDAGIFMRVIEPQLFESYGEWRCIHFPLPDSASLSEQVPCERAAMCSLMIHPATILHCADISVLVSADPAFPVIVNCQR